MRGRAIFGAWVAMSFTLGGLLAYARASPHPTGGRAEEIPVGRVKRHDIERLAGWAAARNMPRAEKHAARALAQVPPGALVRVYLGAWCGDSRREVRRFWNALDQAGTPLPFSVELIAVDESMSAPDGLTSGANLRYVPTFLVLRSGREVGRIVESAPRGIEHDLAAMLRGERVGIVSGRADLAR